MSATPLTRLSSPRRSLQPLLVLFPSVLLVRFFFYLTALFRSSSLDGDMLTQYNAEIDQIFTTELRHKSEEILIKTGQNWQINLYSGVTHGFAVRADLSNKHHKFAKEQTFCQAVNWFNQYL
jgi:dienelactone hydrolase